MIDRLYERGSLAFIYEATITAEHRVVLPWVSISRHIPVTALFYGSFLFVLFIWPYSTCIIYLSVLLGISSLLVDRVPLL